MKADGYLLREGWWKKSIQDLDLDTLGEVVNSTAYPSIDWKHYSHYLPTISDEQWKHLKEVGDIHRVQVTIPLSQRLVCNPKQVLFQWAGEWMLALPEEYQALKKLQETCTHFLGTLLIDNFPEDEMTLYLQGIIRKLPPSPDDLP